MLDLMANGSSWEEIVDLAVRIEDAGATIINTGPSLLPSHPTSCLYRLGIGWHEARVPTIATSVPRGAFSWVTKRLKGSVKVPLCTTNRINTPEVGDAILRDGDADMVSMARFVLLICPLDFSSSFTHSDPSLLILISF
jgi:2,4-dienoyl-CoA reductase (NADPH2)